MVITIPKLADMMVEIASICIQTAQQMTHIRLAMVTAITLIPTIPKLVDLMVEIATSGWNSKYPGCVGELAVLLVGNGVCNSIFNTKECLYDGGDGIDCGDCDDPPVGEMN